MVSESAYRKMSLEELIETRNLIIELIGEKQAATHETLKQEMQVKAAALGIDVLTLSGVGRAARKADGKSAVAAKYRNSRDPSETWAGRGRQPKWLVRELALGKKQEDFAI
jgi:DNA-binding protein H-NS